MTGSRSDPPSATAGVEGADSKPNNHSGRDTDLDALMTLQAVRDPEGLVSDFMYRDMNSAAQSLLGHDRKELIGRRLSQVFPGLGNSLYHAGYFRVFQTGEPEEEEFLSPIHDGHVWIRRKILRLGDGLVVSVRDITAPRQARNDEEARRHTQATEEQFRTLAEAIPQIVWTAQPDGGLDYYNQRWFDYTGLTLEQTMGWGWEPVIHPDDLPTCIQRWTRSFTTGVPYEVEYRFLRASDGAYRWHLGRALPVRDGQGDIIKWFGTCTDIHEQKEANAQLESRVLARTAELHAAKDAAEAASTAKSSFLARMSHELRTPLNAIIGFAAVLERNKRGKLDDVDIRYAQRIRANGGHLLGLINDVLDLSKVEAGHVELSWTRVRVDALMQDVCSVLADRAAEVHVHLAMAGVPSAIPEPALLRADETKLRQVLLNLVSNALKFTPEGGSVVVRLASDSRSGYPLRLEVSDTGIGIPVEAQERVFDAFEQADTSTTATYGGTGLGLSISRALCAAMGFDLILSSEINRGSTFSVIFDRRDTMALPR